MSIPLSALTTNVNFLSQVNFKLTIQHLDFANIEFFCTSVNLPSISIGAVKKNYLNQEAYFPGDTLAYEALKVRFMVDENMNNYIEAYRWLASLSNKNSVSTKPPERMDIILSVLSSKNTSNRQFQFIDAFPVGISELSFDTQAEGVTYIACDMTLRFNYLNVLP